MLFKTLTTNNLDLMQDIHKNLSHDAIPRAEI